MTRFDPYHLLGIAKAASAAEVKSAYRRKVQQAHPDRGGDPDDFILLVRAFGLLADPDARRLYDETGIVDEAGVRNYRREVALILTDMFDVAVATAISTGLDLGRVDFIKQMAVAVDSGLAEARQQLGRADREIRSLQALRQRIRRRDSDKNLFVERLDAQIGTKTEQHLTIKRRLAMLETAVAELGNYENEVELIAALEVEAATESPAS